RMPAKPTLNGASYFFSRLSTVRRNSAIEPAMPRNRTNARMISTLTSTARLLRNTLDSIATPCSVKANGRYFRWRPRPRFKITNCDLKASCSARVSWNMKSAGNRTRLRLTAWLSARVGTPYSAARSPSSMTLASRRTRIRRSMRGPTESAGLGSERRLRGPCSAAASHLGPSTIRVVRVLVRGWPPFSMDFIRRDRSRSVVHGTHGPAPAGPIEDEAIADAVGERHVPFLPRPRGVGPPLPRRPPRARAGHHRAPYAGRLEPAGRGRGQAH